MRLRSQPYMKDLLVILLIFVGVLFFFREELQYNITFFETDTPAYYYPVMSDLAQAYREGTLRLWSPDLFGGFPLFADGESGALYPINFILLSLFTLEQVWVWLIFIRYFLGAVFMYTLGRVLGLGQTASLSAAIVFTFGGFAIGQLHHLNVSNSASWLPLTLAFIELGIRSRRWGRLRWLLLAGISSAVQALGVHVQVVLMSALFLSLYVPFRVILCPRLPFRIHPGADDNCPKVTKGDSPGVAGDGAMVTKRLSDPIWRRSITRLQLFLRQLPKRIVLTCLILGLPGIIGLALALIQLLPEYVLGTFSERAGSVPYSFATQYSLNGYDFLTLLLPYFFRDGGNFWGLWSFWESAIYVGILPLILSVIAVICVRSRYTLFLGAVGMLAFWTALGGNANPSLHQLLYDLPGFNQMRAPARFSYLALLCAALLSAHGIEWLVGEFHSSFKTIGLSLSGKVSKIVFTAFTVLLLPLAFGVPFCLEAATSWFKVNQEFVLSSIRSNLQNLPDMSRDFAAEGIFNHILHGISMENSDVQKAIGLVAGSIILLFLWYRLRSVPWLWKTLVVILIAVDLMSYAAAFHPQMTIQQLSSEPKSIAFLAQNRGLFRTYSWPASSVQPNRLFRFDVPDARGYSSLEFQRNKEYSAVIGTAENRLLDTWNVRYIPMSKDSSGDQLPSFKDTQFQSRPLLTSDPGKNDGASASFNVSDKRATDIRIIGWLKDGADIPQGAEVGSVVLTESSGVQTRLPILAGLDIADGSIDRPDVLSHAKHSRATVAYSMPEQRFDGRPYQEHYYYSNLHILDSESTTVRKVRIEYTYPQGRLQVFGLSLFDSLANQSFALTPFMKEKYRVVYESDNTIIYENLSYLPRSYLVPSAVPVKSNSSILTRMTDGNWDPLKEVFIEAPEQISLPSAQPVPSDGIGKTTITAYKDREVKISATANIDSYLFLADSFYPGWRAFVDGREVQVFQANYLFRAILLPKGPHQILFTYDSVWFKVGAAISLTTVFVLFSLLIFWLSLRARRRRLIPDIDPGGSNPLPSIVPGDSA